MFHRLPQKPSRFHYLPAQVIITGKAGSPETQVLLNAAYAGYVPDKALIPIDMSDDTTTRFWRGYNEEAMSMVEAAGALIT